MMDSVLSALGFNDQQISNDSQSKKLFRISPAKPGGPEQDYETLEVYLSDEPTELPSGLLLWEDGYKEGISVFCRSSVNVARYKRGESFLCKLVRLKKFGKPEILMSAHAEPLEG